MQLACGTQTSIVVIFQAIILNRQREQERMRSPLHSTCKRHKASLITAFLRSGQVEMLS